MASLCVGLCRSNTEIMQVIAVRNGLSILGLKTLKWLYAYITEKTTLLDMTVAVPISTSVFPSSSTQEWVSHWSWVLRAPKLWPKWQESESGWCTLMWLVEDGGLTCELDVLCHLWLSQCWVCVYTCVASVCTYAYMYVHTCVCIVILLYVLWAHVCGAVWLMPSIVNTVSKRWHIYLNSKWWRDKRRHMLTLRSHNTSTAQELVSHYNQGG